jgi:hypothetical protein
LIAGGCGSFDKMRTEMKCPPRHFLASAFPLLERASTSPRRQANKDLKVSEISEAQLHDIFIGARSRFSDGSRVVPVVLKGGPAHEVFLRNHVGESLDEFRNRWRKAVFTGEGAMLREFPSEASLLEYVAATPGAIGYVSRTPDGATVKILSVIH